MEEQILNSLPYVYLTVVTFVEPRNNLVYKSLKRFIWSASENIQKPC